MSTSTPPAWNFLHGHWRDECDAPVTIAELSPHSCILSDSATLGDQCANGEQSPPSALIPSDQCDECRAAPGQPHATGCEGTAPLTDSVSNVAPSHRIGTCYLDPDTGETVMPGDFFGEKELRWKPDKDRNLHDGEPIRKVAEPARFAHEAPTTLPVGARSEHPDRDAELLTSTVNSSRDVFTVREGNRLLDSMERTFNDCLDIAVAKNHDYAADVDPFLNFRECGRFGVGIDSGILVRMSDKWSRLCQLAQPRKTAAVSDETLIDTVLDLINYAAILVAVYGDEA